MGHRISVHWGWMVFFVCFVLGFFFFLDYLLPSVIIGNDTKDQQVRVNSVSWLVMDNGLALH